MNDHDILRMAAKAAGISFFVDSRGREMQMHGGLMPAPWNPLADDGDALRLAADLELIISIDSEFTRATDGMLEGVVLACGDRYAATRRAIVRAAAAIGEAMQ